MIKSSHKKETTSNASIKVHCCSHHQLTVNPLATFTHNSGVAGLHYCNNHGHMDAGSFAYDGNGVRWSVDLGMQSYAKIEKALKQTG